MIIMINSVCFYECLVLCMIIEIDYLYGWVYLSYMYNYLMNLVIIEIERKFIK